MTTSSIQYLKDTFVTIQYLLRRDEITDSQADDMLQNVYQKAKEMHKEEIVDAYMEGFDDYREDYFLPAWCTSEDYYNETFKKDGDE